MSAALVCGACGDGAARDTAAAGAEPTQGSGSAMPAQQAGGSAGSGQPAPEPAPPASTPAGSEAPAVGSGTPVATPEQTSGGTPQVPAPEMPAPEMPAPEMPAPEMPAPEMPAPEMPAPEPPAPEPLPPGVDPNFFVFLLIGQSNMEGAPASEQQDRTASERVKVLALRDCPQRNQQRNQWYTAAPSLHTCGNSLGPGDYFAKTLAEALPNVTIGLVPDAIAGVDIDIFRKGVVSQRRGEFFLPPDNQRNSAYETVIERARLAQQVGVIKGILFHQGESDAANGTLQNAWPGKVQGLVQDLRADLGIGNVPFLAGELLANGAPQNGCCGNAMNPRVNALPEMIPGAFVVSGAGLGVQADGLHYNVVGQREFGRRYGQVMLDALGL